jgi:hypothetical protein
MFLHIVLAIEQEITGLHTQLLRLIKYIQCNLGVRQAAEVQVRQYIYTRIGIGYVQSPAQ